MASDAEKLRRVIEASGLSTRRFAREVLLREERTVRRWLDGTSPIGEVVASKLDTWLVENPVKQVFGFPRRVSWPLER